MFCMKVKRLVVHSCLTLCYPMDYSSPDSYLHRILQGRTLEQLPFPSPGDLSGPGIEPRSSALQANSLPSEPPGKPTSTIIIRLHVTISNQRPNPYWFKQ